MFSNIGFQLNFYIVIIVGKKDLVMIRFTAANYTSFIIYIRLPTYTVLLGVDNLNT